MESEKVIRLKGERRINVVWSDDSVALGKPKTGGKMEPFIPAEFWIQSKLLQAANGQVP